jgi:RNA polymerase sigma factor (sigma-70 family)
MFDDDKLNDLMDEFLACNEQSYWALFDLCKNELLGYIAWAFKLKETAVTAEDCVQETLIRIYELKRERFRRTGNLRALLLTIAKMKAVDVHRRRRREERGRIEIESAASSEATHSPAYEPDLWDVIYQLPPMQRQVILSRYWLGMDYKAISKLMGKKQSTLRSAALRGLGTIRRQWRIPPGPHPGVLRKIDPRTGRTREIDPAN